MLAKRVVAVAKDKALGKRLVQAALAAGAVAQWVTDVDALAGRFDADLYVYALSDAEDHGLQRLFNAAGEKCRLLPLVPASDLPLATRLLFRPQVQAVLCLEGLEQPLIAATISKLLHGDLFGLDKVLSWGVKVHSRLVADYHEKAVAISEVAEFAEALGVRRKYREAIEQVLDELLMNALYDAPVDDQGLPLFAKVAIKDRLNLRADQAAVVQYACDGERFALAVRDGYGTLRKATVLSYLDKCLYAAGGEQIDRKESGAGLGLYIVASSATQIAFHILPEVATEVVCTFDLTAPKLQPRALGIFEERIAAGPGAEVKRVMPRRRRDDLVAPPASPPRALQLALLLSSALLLVAVALVVWPLFNRPAPASLIVETEPPGATVYLDGRARGLAHGPLRIDGLDAGGSYALRATLPGRREQEVLVHAQKGEQRVALRLEALAAGNLTVESVPPGCEVLVDGKESGRVTPATLELPPGGQVRLTLRKAGYVEQTLSVTPGALGERAVYRTTLPLSPEVAVLALDVVLQGGAAVTPQVEVDGLTLLPPGLHHEALLKPRVPHRVVVTARGYAAFSDEVRLESGQRTEVRAQLEPGGTLSVSANLPLRLVVDGEPQGKLPREVGLRPGPHTIALRGSDPFVAWEEKVTVANGKTVELAYELGTVRVTVPGAAFKHPLAPRNTVELGLPAGRHRLRLLTAEGEQEVEVMIRGGEKQTLDRL